MPRVVKLEFDVAGATAGTKTIPCDPQKSVTGNFNVYLAWDTAEQRAGRTVNATIKVATPGLFFFKVLIRDRATPSAANPRVPNFVWPTAYEVIGPLLGWKVTALSTTYTYSCSTGCVLSINSSRGGRWTDTDSSETVRGIITLRSGGNRYDRRTASEVTVECEDDKEVSYVQPPGTEQQYALAMDKLFEKYVIEQTAQSDILIAEAIQTIATTYGPPPADRHQQALPPRKGGKRR